MLLGHMETWKFRISINQHEQDSADNKRPSEYLYIKKELTHICGGSNLHISVLHRSTRWNWVDTKENVGLSLLFKARELENIRIQKGEVNDISENTSVFQPGEFDLMW